MIENLMYYYMSSKAPIVSVVDDIPMPDYIRIMAAWSLVLQRYWSWPWRLWIIITAAFRDYPTGYG
jgi:hypothetical protein